MKLSCNNVAQTRMIKINIKVKLSKGLGMEVQEQVSVTDLREQVTRIDQLQGSSMSN